MKKSTLIIVLLFVSAAIFAQDMTGSVKAIIKDNTGVPISFSSVSLMSLPGSNILKGQTTDENGIVFFDNLSVGNYGLAISFIGHSYRKK